MLGFLIHLNYLHVALCNCLTQLVKSGSGLVLSPESTLSRYFCTRTVGGGIIREERAEPILGIPGSHLRGGTTQNLVIKAAAVWNSVWSVR